MNKQHSFKINWRSDQTGAIKGMRNSLEEKEPKAFAALPEAYQNDNCLSFRRNGNGLYCWPQPNQVTALRNWTHVFNDETAKWVRFVVSFETL